MLRRIIADLEGVRVLAADGDVGRVFDAYVDDRRWVLRYLVVDSSSWLTRRRVLVSPASFGVVDWEARTIAVHLTQDQVRQSPEIEPHGPPTRQYEAAYFDSLGYSYYWLGPGVWGATALPSALAGSPALLPPVVEPAELATPGPAETAVEDARSGSGHLQSASVVAGVRVEAGDETGELVDLLVDESTWQVPYLAVQGGHGAGPIRVPAAAVRSAHWDDRRIVLDRALDDASSPPRQVTAPAKPD